MTVWRRIAASTALLLCGAFTQPLLAADQSAQFPETVPQGSLIIGKVAPGSRVRYADRDLLVTSGGEVVFGVGREEKGPVHVDVRERSGHHETR